MVRVLLPGEKCPIPWKPCEYEFCSRWFVAQLSHRRRFCSALCGDNQGRLDRGLKPRTMPLFHGDCRQCGAHFVSMLPVTKFCSNRCSIRARKGRSKRARRGRIGANGRVDNFTLREVAQRDGWRCHLCCKPVPDRDYRARPLDPTIDHLVPVSAGGTHTLDNVALAHNRCNYERSTGGDVQLRLVG